MTDAFLAGDSAERAQGGLEAELARAMPRLRAHIAGRGRGRDAEDLAQETAARALRYRGRVDPGRALFPWLRRVADRLLFDDARREGRASLDAREDDPPAPCAAPEIESREEVARLVARLGEREREVLLRFHVEGESIEQIASALRVPTGTVKSSLSRARRRLAEELSDRRDER